jgi:glutathione peroxidase
MSAQMSALQYFNHAWCLAAALSVLALLMPGGVASAGADACPAYLNQDLHKLRSSETLNICKSFAGKPLLIVNTASHCGFTPQFKGLQALHEKYQSRGLVVLGFPSDSFLQEAKADTETAEVCYINYGVKFPMLAVSAVRGSDANSIFQELNRQAGAPRWNFNKYLLTPDGKVVKHFGSMVTPESPELNSAIEALLPQM